MTTDVSVSFSGNTTNLDAAIAQAKSNLTSFAPATTDQSRASLDALGAALRNARTQSDIATAGWRENLRSLADFTIVVRGAIDLLKEAGQGAVAGQSVPIAAEIGVVQAQVEALDSVWQAHRVTMQADADVYGVLKSAAESAASTVGSVVVTNFEAAEAAAKRLAVANGLLLGSLANEAAVMTVATQGQLNVLKDEVSRANTVIQKQIQDNQEAYDKAGGLSMYGRVITSGGPTLEVPSLNDPALPTADDRANAYAHADAMDGLQASIKSVGDAIDEFAAKIAEIPETSQKAAQSIEAALTNIPSITVDANAAIIQLLQSISSTGDEAQAFSKQIISAFSDAKNGGEQLAQIVSKVADTEEQIKIAQSISSAFSPAQAQQAIAFFNAIKTGIDKQRDGLQTVEDDYQNQYSKLSAIGKLVDDRIGKERQVSEARQAQIASMTDESNKLKDNLATWTAIVDKVKQQADFVAAIKADTTTPTAVIAAAQASLKVLQPTTTMQGQSNSGVKPTAEEMDLLVRTMIGEAGSQGADGLAAVAAVIRNRVDSAFDGMKTYESVIMEGNGKQFNTWKPGNAAGDMATAVSPDSAAYQRAQAIAEQIIAGTLKDPTGGATSFYRTDLPSEKQFPMTNTTTIKDQIYGNTPGSPPVLDNTTYQKRLELIQSANANIKQGNDLLAGGTPTQLAQLGIAKQNATAAEDAVANAQKEVEARKADLTAMGMIVTAAGKIEVADASKASATQRTAAETAYYTAVGALRSADVARDKSAVDLKAANLRVGSEQRLSIVNDELTKEQKGYEEHSAKWNELEKQKVENARQYQQAQQAVAADAENAKFDAEKRGFTEQQELIKANAQTTGEMRQSDYDQLAEVLTRQAEAERAHYQALQQIYADDPKQYAKYAQLITQVDAREHQLQLDNTLAYQRQVTQAYRSSFEEVGSTVSSSLMQMLQGQATFRDLMRSVVLDIIQQFVQARIKMVADWAAGIAQKTLTTVAGEAQQTAAVSAGAAARVGIEASANTAATAAKTAAAAKSITSSAAETYAGVFGFLSPVLGPFAAGPAAAAAALVGAEKALVGFETGAWQTPATQLALIHKNEMVVPAGATPWAQSVMAAAASSGGGSGGLGSIHLHNPMDGESVKRFFERHGDHILSSINQAVAKGGHLRFNRLR